MATLYKPFKGDYPITSGYGNRADPISGQSTFHNGIDFGVPANTPLYNLEDGEVVVAGVIDNFNPNSPNLAVGVKADSDGVVAVYMHMNRIDVNVGQRLSGGQQIGLSGNTGYSTGAHLHFGLYSKLWNSTIDPTFLLNQWAEVGGNSNNNNNMSDIMTFEYVKNNTSNIFFNTKYNSLPSAQPIGSDGLGWGSFRAKIHNNEDEGGQRPHEATQMLMDGYFDYYNQSQAQINSLSITNQDLQNQVRDQGKDILELRNQRASLESKVQTLNVDNNTLKDKVARLEKQILDYAQNPITTEKIVYLTDEAVKKENEDLKKEIEGLKAGTTPKLKFEIPEKLKSRKLGVALIGLGYAILATFNPVLQPTVTTILTFLGTYVLGQSGVDVAGALKEGQDEAKKITPVIEEIKSLPTKI